MGVVMGLIHVGFKSLLRQGLSEPEFYGINKSVGTYNFQRSLYYKKIGYTCNINVLQQTTCLVVNPIAIDNFACFFNCTPVGRTSGSMMVPI